MYAMYSSASRQLQSHTRQTDDGGGDSDSFRGQTGEWLTLECRLKRVASSLALYPNLNYYAIRSCAAAVVCVSIPRREHRQLLMGCVSNHCDGIVSWCTRMHIRMEHEWAKRKSVLHLRKLTAWTRQ